VKKETKKGGVTRPNVLLFLAYSLPGLQGKKRKRSITLDRDRGQRELCPNEVLWIRGRRGAMKL